MVGASKILTVSYGTFSCTLEGFDDPFSTMKAIAEYFRELAADDRFFGAEPPTPDANMLHRIAEREIQRRVEAKISDKGVILRAERPAAAGTGAQPEPATARRPAMDLASILAARARSAAAPAATGQTPAAGIAADSDEDSIAAKLDRIRAVVTASEPDAESAFDNDDQSEDYATTASDTADFGFDVDLGTAPDVIGAAGDESAAADEYEDSTEDLRDTQGIADLPAREISEPDAATPDTAIADDDHETVEAVASDEVPGPATAAEVFAGDEAPRDAQTEDKIIGETDEAQAAGTGEEIAAEDEEPRDTAAADATAGMMDEAPDAPAEDDLAKTETAAEADAPKARVIKIQRAPTAPTEAETAAPDEAETAATDEPSRSAIFAALADDIEGDAAEPDEPQNEELDTAEDDALLAGIGAAIGASGPEAEDDDALLREMAALARDSRRDAHEGLAIFESTSRDDDASVERLMEEAKSKLEGDENRRRFSAISHLKAAVAATVADRQMKSHGTPEVDPGEGDATIDRYRDDLSKAVRPRRPEAEPQAATPRPAQPGSTPLVLVSEQRIDTPESGVGQDAVRPRRIDAANFMRDEEDDRPEAGGDEGTMISPADAKNFAEFAERLGATSLSELLEAAAAYTATVEGQPHFSRPQILRKVANVSEDADYSREDGLRSFGMLLREGKIQKISRGQFTITEASKFLSEDRTASR